MNKITCIKNKDYTTISNSFFRDKNLSLKAKGLLALVLTLPSDWDFSIKGLESIVKEGKTSIYSTIDELKEFGYCVVKKIRNEKGVLLGIDYSFFETPYSENPYTENPNMDNPCMDNQPQINTDITNIENKQNTDNNKKELKEKSKLLFEECWVEYKRKGNKKQSFGYWQKLNEDEQQKIIYHIKAYVGSREMKYQKDFERYLRDKVFNDVVFDKNGRVLYDPARNATQEYAPQTDLTLFYDNNRECYMYTGYYNDYIPDGYNDKDRPNGATVALNNGRMVVWSKEKLQWINQ